MKKEGNRREMCYQLLETIRFPLLPSILPLHFDTLMGRKNCGEDRMDRFSRGQKIYSREEREEGEWMKQDTIGKMRKGVKQSNDASEQQKRRG